MLATLDSSKYKVDSLVTGEGIRVINQSGTYNSKNVMEAYQVTVSLSSGDYIPAPGTSTLTSNYAKPENCCW